MHQYTAQSSIKISFSLKQIPPGICFASNFVKIYLNKYKKTFGHFDGNKKKIHRSSIAIFQFS